MCCILKSTAGDLKIEKIHISSTVTINLGNYQATKPTAAITVIPDKDQNLEDIFKAGWEFLDKQIVEQSRMWKRKVSDEII